MTVEVANAVLDALELEPVFIGEDGNEIETPDPGAVITASDPEAGSIVRIGSEVRLTLSLAPPEPD